jgi:hypothetical protein
MLALSTDINGIIHFTTTVSASIKSLGALWEETSVKKPPFKTTTGGGFNSAGFSDQIQHEKVVYTALPEVHFFSYSNNVFELEGLDEKLFVGKQELSYPAHSGASAYKSDKYDFKRACVTTSHDAEHAEVDAHVHLQRIWDLVNKAFDRDLFVTVKGTVSNIVSAPSEATVRAVLARAAAGEAITIPAATTTRTLYVTDVVLTKSGGASG